MFSVVPGREMGFIRSFCPLRFEIRIWLDCNHNVPTYLPISPLVENTLDTINVDLNKFLRFRVSVSYYSQLEKIFIQQYIAVFVLNTNHICVK